MEERLKLEQIVVLKKEIFILSYRALKYRILIIKRIFDCDNIRGENICYSPKTRFLKPFHFSKDEIERIPTEEEIIHHTFKSKAR